MIELLSWMSLLYPWTQGSTRRLKPDGSDAEQDGKSATLYIHCNDIMCIPQGSYWEVSCNPTLSFASKFPSEGQKETKAIKFKITPKPNFASNTERDEFLAKFVIPSLHFTHEHEESKEWQDRLFSRRSGKYSIANIFQKANHDFKGMFDGKYTIEYEGSEWRTAAQGEPINQHGERINEHGEPISEHSNTTDDSRSREQMVYNPRLKMQHDQSDVMDGDVGSQVEIDDDESESMPELL